MSVHTCWEFLLKYCSVLSVLIAVPAAAADKIIINTGETETLENSKYSEYSTTDSNGGVVFNAGDLNIGAGVIMSGNQAVFGGAVWNEGNLTQIADTGQLSFYKNQANSAGGAIYNNGVIDSLTHVLFQENSAAMGGAINNSNLIGAGAGGVIKLIANSSFIGNYAGSSQGGAIRNQGKIEDIKDSLFMQNASGNGGAINNGSWGSVVNGIINTQFVNNTALNGDFQQGGAITNAGTIGIIDKSVFSGNQAGKIGGAIANVENQADAQPTITIKDTQFLNNRAGENGGAIYNALGGKITLRGDNIFSGNTAGDFANDIHNLGELIIADGTTKIGGGISGDGQMIIADGATLDIGATTVDQGIINLNGTVSMSIINSNSYGRLLADNYNIGENGAVDISLGTAGEYDLFSTDADININYNDALYNMTQNGGTVIFETKSVDEIAKSNNLTTNAAAVLSGLANTDNYSIGVASLNAQQALADGNIGYVEDEAAKLRAEDKPVVQSVAASVQNQVLSLVSGRMSGGTIGRNGGDAVTTDYGVWGHGIFNKTKYSDVFSGYTRGLAVGADTLINKKYTIGAGYSYSNSDIDSVSRDTDIESNTLFVYGQYQPNKWFINAALNYTMAKYTETASAFGVLFESEYDVNSFGGQIMTGYDFASGLTPEIGARYLHISHDDYNNGVADICVDDTNFLTGVAGLDYSFIVGSDWKMKLRPQLHAAATYDFLSDSVAANVMIPGAASYVVNGDALSRMGGEFGIGLGVLYDGWDITLNYDLNLRENYTSHTGMLKFRYDF